ncbi:DNA adenine methylase [Bacillus safensis]|uniref:DNA adenine methylase n=1 Tax=Bacillus safensis TaxID=561879 RepID=UPI001243FCFA|nr:DNA adenine methylase [Bacillus safensis]
MPRATLTPLRYPGGKDKTYNYVRHLILENKLTSYIEPFAGGAAVAIRLLINEDVERIYINDVDKSIYCLWKTIINHPDSLIEKIKLTPLTMDEWHKQKHIQKNKETADDLSLAFSTLFLNRTNRSGIIKAGVIGGKNQDGNDKMDCRFNKNDIINRIELIAAKASRIKVYNYDAIEFIEKVVKNTRRSLTFFDPPYYDKGPDLYTNFYGHEDHVKLAKVIQKQMRNRYWILTYDIAEEIKKLYSRYNYQKYYLNYSIAKPTKGQEFMFFSSKIKPGNFRAHLQTV